MVVPAFGFSAGDFIAAVGVLRKTARALRDTGGAASQYQHTVLKLRSMRCALIRLQSLEPQNEDASVVEEIRKCSKACIIPLDKFLNSIANLDREFGHKGRTWRKSFTQAKWALKLEPELRQLEASLDAEVQPLQILLQLDERDSRTESDKNILETRDLARHTSNLLEGLVASYNDTAAKSVHASGCAAKQTFYGPSRLEERAFSDHVQDTGRYEYPANNSGKIAAISRMCNHLDKGQRRSGH